MVMRPEAPVPGTWARSTLLSLAILRTSGEERTRSPVGGSGGAAAAGGWSGGGCGQRLPELQRRGRRLCQQPPPITATTVLIVTVAPSGNLDLGEHAGDGRGNLGVDLVGRDLEDRLVALNGVADLLQPLGDGALGDGLAHLRHQDFGAGAGRVAAEALPCVAAGASTAAGSGAVGCGSCCCLCLRGQQPERGSCCANQLRR